MNKNLFKKIFLSFSLFFTTISLSGCNNNEEIIEPCNHNWVNKITKEGSCLEKEEITIYCSICNEIKEVKEGDYKDHVLEETYIKNPNYETNNHFIFQSKCKVCNKIIDEEEVVLKDHYFVLSSKEGNEANYKKKYKCLICEKTYEYVFSLDDYEYSLNEKNKVISLHKYNGKDTSIYVPKIVKYLNENYKVELDGGIYNNNLYINNLKIDTSLNSINYSFFNNLINLEFIDFSSTEIVNFDYYSLINLPKIKEIIFPNTLKYFYDAISNVPLLKTFDFSNTNLQYIFVDEFIELNVEKIIYPATLISQYYSPARYELKEIIVDSNDPLPSIYYWPTNEKINTFSNYYKLIKYQKLTESLTNIKLVFPNNEIEEYKLPYGDNLFDVLKDIKLNKETNKKIGWYLDKTCYLPFNGLIPNKDIILYGMELRDADLIYLNKHLFLEPPEKDKDNNYIIESPYSLRGLYAYMLTFDVTKVTIITDLSVEEVNTFITFLPLNNFDIFGGQSISPLTIGSIKDLSEDKRIITLSMSSYDENFNRWFKNINVEEILLKHNFDYTSNFSHFNYGELNRNENFEDFKYKKYTDKAINVANSTILGYLLALKINVEPLKNSSAEKTMNLYKNIARNIFNDTMNDYEKIVAFNKYLQIYKVEGSSGSLNMNYPRKLYRHAELIPFCGTYNCETMVIFPQIIYGIEGISFFNNDQPNHTYGVIKFNNKFYLSDHTDIHEAIEYNKNFKYLSGYYDWSNFKEYDESMGEERELTYLLKYYMSLNYPGIKLEKYHYE